MEMNLKDLENRIAGVRQAANRHLCEADADKVEVVMMTDDETRHHTNGMSIDLQFGESLDADIVIY